MSGKVDDWQYVYDPGSQARVPAPARRQHRPSGRSTHPWYPLCRCDIVLATLGRGQVADPVGNDRPHVSIMDIGHARVEIGAPLREVDFGPRISRDRNERLAGVKPREPVITVGFASSERPSARHAALLSVRWRLSGGSAATQAERAIVLGERESESQPGPSGSCDQRW